MSTREHIQGKIAAEPTIYAYELPEVPNKAGLLKVGYTDRPAEIRVAEQGHELCLKKNLKLVRSSMRPDGTYFLDTAVHKLLRQKFNNPEGEWFRCKPEDVEKAIKNCLEGRTTMLERTETFPMRDEQIDAVDKASAYFKSFIADPDNEGKIPHFLWNAKMRFGKTFTSYQLALKMGWTKVLVLTFKPAVKTAWKEDLMTHVDFEGWQFCEKQDNREFNTVDESKPFVCFASFQDVLGKNAAGGIKATNEWIETVEWDCIILDEYHFGAWGDNAKKYYNTKDDIQKKIEETTEIMEEDADSKKELEAREIYDEDLMPLQTKAYLYLSGTPFRAINSGEFIEEQIFNWTYSDEQEAKAKWDSSRGHNPYLALPQMVMLTYKMPDQITEIAKGGEFDEFDLNEFFRAEKGSDVFIHEEYVQKWLDLIRGANDALLNLKLGNEKPPMPYSDVDLLNYLGHTYWFLPSVASCDAMEKLLAKPCNSFYHAYKVVNASGNKAGMGADALKPVLNAMGNPDPQQTRTITLSCGKLSTGVTVRPWTGILMLRNTTSPETYFQAAFRVQSPWTLKDEYGKEVVLKPIGYIFDFAPNRALRQVDDYSCNLNVNLHNPEEKVAEFIKFLPILAYDGSSMRPIDAGEVLDMAMSGTTATLLARRWESAILVNVDNGTLQKLLNNPEALRALMNIEGFRTLNQDIETIINKSEHVKNTKKQKGENLTPKEKKELTEEEKEYRSKRKEIQEKLIKFATRIPVFMYLTDYRERSLYDVITQLETGLFRKVTGLTLEDFQLLVSLNVFNEEKMNDAVFHFKRYEDSSLTYTKIDTRHKDKMGLWNKVVDVEPEQEDPTKEIIEKMNKEESDKVNKWKTVKAGDNITHKSLGTGVVESVSSKYIKVSFDGQVRTFNWPGAYEKGFLIIQ